MIILSIYGWCIARLERFTQTRYWAAKATAIIILAALLFHAFPSIRTIIDQAQQADGAFGAVLMKAQDLSRDLTLDYAPETNMAKQNFRLLMPILTAVFNLHVVGLYAVQVGFGIAIIYLTLRLAERLVHDRVTAVLIGALVATIYAGATAFVEVGGRFDAPSLFFLVLALYVRHPVLIAASVFLASWNDERGLIASILVLAFHYIDTPGVKKSLASHLQAVFSPQILAVVAAWALYLGSRFAFAYFLSISTPPVDVIHYFISNLNWLPFGVWTAFEGGWLLVFVSVSLLIVRRRYLETLLVIVGLAIILFTALSVVDISRSTAYALPMIFVAVRIIYAEEGQRSVRALSFAAAVMAVICPMYYLEGSLNWITPLPAAF